MIGVIQISEYVSSIEKLCLSHEYFMNVPPCVQKDISDVARGIAVLLVFLNV